MIDILIFKQQNCAPCKALTDSINDKPVSEPIQWHDMSNPTDETVELSLKFNVRSAPTVVVLKDNVPYYSGTMVKTSEQLQKLIDEANG